MIAWWSASILRNTCTSPTLHIYISSWRLQHWHSTNSQFLSFRISCTNWIHTPHIWHKPNKKHYNFGLACLHIRICAFLWCCKIYLYQDIRRYSKRKGEAYLVKQRMEELRYKMKNCKELELDVFKVVPGKGSTVFLTTISLAMNSRIFNDFRI